MERYSSETGVGGLTTGDCTGARVVVGAGTGAFVVVGVVTGAFVVVGAGVVTGAGVVGVVGVPVAHEDVIVHGSTACTLRFSGSITLSEH